MKFKAWHSWFLAGTALLIYILGGIAVMLGLAMIGIMGNQDFLGWGESRGLGYLAFGLGIIFSILGVLIMRIMRNRKWA
ncbi:MAG: hypothetical protein JRE16_12025 [Deltaproteobacteria bacterium]|jgi:hypothetical protein|nr:hypothetical protein [Deltaproteobacteria bacterium]MBW2518755.1 hypothetical protein [Deltaproteobacteria bacterium]